MSVDVSRFYLHNITDTCAVWNVLSSRCLLHAALTAGVVFVCTRVVVYECLFKARKRATPTDDELRARFDAAQRAARIAVFPLEIEDLQSIEILQKRKRFGMGELSSIAFAIKTRQAFLTDDQRARKLAREILPSPGAQTTPHLLGWLFFTSQLTDSDKDTVIREHREVDRPLAPFFEDIYVEACRCRLMTERRI